MINFEGKTLALPQPPADYKQLTTIILNLFQQKTDRLVVRVGAVVLSEKNFKAVHGNLGDDTASASKTEGLLYQVSEAAGEEEQQLSKTVVKGRVRGSREKQTQTELDQVVLVEEKGIDMVKCFKESVRHVMQSLKYQVDLKLVNLTINDVECKKCRKYPIIGRVLYGEFREVLCQPCFGAIHSTSRTPWLGQGLIGALFKKRVEDEQLKRQYIVTLKELTGSRGQYFQKLMLNNPRQSVDWFLEQALEF